METGECEKLAEAWGVPGADVPKTCAFVAAITQLKDRLAPGAALADIPPELLELIHTGAFARLPFYRDSDSGVYEVAPPK